MLQLKRPNIWPEATKKLISVGDESQAASVRTMSADVKLEFGFKLNI